MTQDKTIKNYSNFELQMYQKKTKGRLFIQSILLMLLIGTSIFITIKKGFNFFTIFPVFILIIFIPTLQLYNKVNKEIKTRNL
jgi:hypothetical protein